jgi:hypothetical protein
MKSFKTKAICFILTISTCLLFAPNVVTASLSTFNPVESNQVLNNPFMGWVPWGNVKNYPQPHSMVFAQTTWRELEPQKGVYKFSEFEEKYNFDYWRSVNKKILIQINLDYPDKFDHIDIPDWLYNEIDGDGIHYNVDYGMGFSPNYSNPKLINYHSKLIEMLAKRYNNDNAVYMVVLGSIGHWGEWHTSQDLVNAFPKLEISDQYVKPYIDGFTNKFLSVRRPLQIAKDNNMGLHNNSIGNDYQTNTLFLNWIKNGYTWFLTDESNPAMPDFWKTSPSGGEFTAYPGTSLLTDSNISNTLNQLISSHTSWIGPSCPINESINGIYQNNMDKVLKTIGYRFVLQSISHPKSAIQNTDIDISMKWINRGVAPFYYDWPVELSLSDSNGNIAYKTTVPIDIRTILPGEKSIDFTMKLPKEINTGTYKLCVAILDPENNKPGVDLAIEGRRDDGRYELDSISIEAPIPEPTETPKPIVTPNVTKTPSPVETPMITNTPSPVKTTMITRTPKTVETPKITRTPKPTKTFKITNTCAPVRAFIESDNKYVIEAEDYDKNIQRSNHKWTLDTSIPSSSGKGIMVALPDNYFNVDTGYSKTSPQLDYNVYFTEAGRYYVWVRGYGRNPNSDSLHIGLDGIETESSSNIYTGSLEYRWCRYSIDRDLLYIDVETPGLHTINVYLREDGVGFDKIILVNDKSYIPSGIGPDASKKVIINN